MRVPVRQYSKVFSRILLVLTLLLLLATAMGFIYFRLNKDSIFRSILKTANEQFQGEITIDKIDFSPFVSFPNWAIQLSQVKVLPPISEDSAYMDSGAILDVEKVSLTFNVLDFLQDEINVEEIVLDNGTVLIIVFENGLVNIFDAFSPPEKEGNTTASIIHFASDPGQVEDEQQNANSEDFQYTINLESFQIENLNLDFVHKVANMEILGTIPDAYFKFIINSDLLEGAVSSGLLVHSVIFDKSEYLTNKDIELDLDFSYNDSTGILNVPSGNINFEDVLLNASGSYNADNDGELNFDFSANDQQLTILSYLFEDNILDNNLDFLSNGSISVYGTLRGKSRIEFPSMKLTVRTEDLKLDIPGTNESITVQTQAILDFGDKNDLSHASLSIDTLKGSLSGGLINGSFSIRNFVNPYIRVHAQLDTDLGEYDKIFKLNNVIDLEGNLFLNTLIQGTFDDGENSITKEEGYINASFRDVSFKLLDSLREDHFLLNGNLDNQNNDILFENLKVGYNSSDLTLDGSIKDFMAVILELDHSMNGDMTISSEQINISEVLCAIGADSIDLDPSVSQVNDFSTNLKFNLAITDSDSNQGVENDIFQISNLAFNIPYILSSEGSNLVIDIDQDQNMGIDVDQMDLDLFQGSVKIENSRIKLNPDSTFYLDLNSEIRNIQTLDIVKFQKLLSSNDTTITDTSNQLVEYLDIDLTTHFNFLEYEITDLKIMNSNLIYFHGDSSFYTFDNVNIILDEPLLLDTGSTGIIPGIKYLNGTLDAENVNSLTFNNISVNGTAYVWMDSINIDVGVGDNYAKKENLISFHSSIIDSIPRYEIGYQNNAINIEEVLESFTDEKILLGKLAMELYFTSEGNSKLELLRNSVGTIRLNGSDIDILSIDVDDLLTKFEKTQNFNIADVGAVFLVGPLGAVITKGSDFGKLINYQLEEGDITNIHQFRSDWDLNKGVITSKDVGFTTDVNRIVLNGRIDLARDSIENITVSVIDEKGCSKLDQSIYGRYDSIQYGETKVVGKVFGAVVNILKVVTGNNCEPVYLGELEHPNENQN